jgi:serine/threonine protein kinase
MSSECQRCGRNTPDDTPKGICPVCCLLDLGFGDSDSATNEENIPGIELGIPLGQGSSGTVFEGIELHSGYRRVAVKILRTDIAGSAQRARFLEEMQILALLNHPHLATLHNSGRTTSGNPFYVMELIEGKTLDNWARSAALPEKITILRQVTEAVAYAHQQGIAHRDLKPANILIEKATNKAKVIDFGIARAFHGPASWGREATHLAQRIGTPHYMSPEQLAGDPKVDLRTDIWSLGLLLYELALGPPLLTGVIDLECSWEENAANLRSFPFPKIPNCELDWIARKACALKPDDRYQTGQALLDDLRAWETGEAVSVGLSYRTYRFRKSLLKHRLAYVLGTAAALILILLTISSWLLSTKERNAKKSITAALSREQTQHQKTLAAKAQTLRASSDSALIAGTRAIDTGDFTAARESFDQALSLWPQNSAARFARNYLDATFPEAQLDSTHTLPFSPTLASPHPESGFLLRSPDGKTHHFKNDKPLELSSLPLTPPPLTDESLRLKLSEPKPGVLEVRDLNTNNLLLTPFTFGSGPEKAIYSTIDQTVLVIGRGPEVQLWNLSRLRQGFQSATLETVPRWLEFHDDTSDLLIGNQKTEVWRWPPDSAPKFFLDWPVVEISYDRWETGENHHHGLFGNATNTVGYLQMLSWQMNPKSRLIIYAARAREVNHLFVARSDGSLWLQVEGSPYRKIKSGIPDFTTAAISSSGETAVRISGGSHLEHIDLSTKETITHWELPHPALDLSILDNGQFAIAHTNGTVTIWDPREHQKPVRTVTVASAAPAGFHIRSIPGKPEFLVCLDGDIAIRHFSVLTGELIGPTLRHQKGIHWFCVTGDPDILFSIDQEETGPGALRIWSLRLGREIVPALQHPDIIHWATTIDQGSRLATACADGKVRRWILEKKLPVPEKNP